MDCLSDWCKSYSFPPLQSNPSAVALYLTSLSDRGLSRSSILGAAYGIAWLHKKLGCPNPVDDPLVSQTLAGFKRLLAGPSRKKQPVESHQVRALIRSYGHPRASLPYLQMVSLVAVDFCAFLRWSELRDLRACDLKFCATHMSILLDRRKNDQFRRGAVVKVSRLPSSSFPVKLLESFLKRGEHQPSQSLFCLCQKLGTGYKLRQAPLSYSRAREQFRQMISELGLDSNELVYIAFVQVVLPKRHAAEFLGEYGVDMVVGAVSKLQMVMLMNRWEIPLWYLEIWLFNSYDVICLINIARVLLYAAVWRVLHLPLLLLIA